MLGETGRWRAIAAHLVVGAVVAAGLVTNPTAAEETGEPPVVTDPARILLYGDSYLQGFSGDWTVRYRVWQQLSDSGATVDFVGPRTDVRGFVSWTLGEQLYRYPSFDRDHAAIGGMTFTRPRWTVSSLVSGYSPDVVVGMIGWNDMMRGLATPTGLADEWRRQIGLIREVSPVTDVVLVPYPVTWYPASVEYADALAGLATELDSPQSRVVVTQPVSYSMTVDTYDRAHPSAAGERKLASAIASSLGELGIGAATDLRTQWTDPTTARFAPSLVATVLDGPRLRLSWRSVDYASAADVVVQDVTSSSTGDWKVVAAKRLATTEWTIDVTAGRRYRAWLMPVKGYLRMGTRSPKVTVESP